ncbi:hypothetical protein Tco_0000611 [Tanacetum coccineum]
MITKGHAASSRAGTTTPDYVPHLKHPPSLDYVPGPEYPEYVALSDDEIPVEDQPLPANASPTAISLGYVADSDLEEDPKVDPEEDLREDPVDYHADGGDDEEEEEEKSSKDDDNKEEEKEEASEDDKDKEEEEEEEHLALTDPISPRSPQIYVPFSQTSLCRARKTVRHQPPMPASMEARIVEYAFAPTPPLPPPSLLLPWSSPLPQIPSPPLHLHHHPLLASEIPSQPLLLPSIAHKEDIPEADMPLRKRASFTTSTSRFEVGESLSAAAARQTRHTLACRVDYGFIDTMDASIRASKSRAMTAMEEDDRALLRAQVSLLTRERRYFRSMASSYEREGTDSRQALAHFESRSQAIEAQIRALQRDISVLQVHSIDDGDRLTSHIKHEHNKFRELVLTREAGPQDGPADAGSSC